MREKFFQVKTDVFLGRKLEAAKIHKPNPRIQTNPLPQKVRRFNQAAVFAKKSGIFALPHFTNHRNPLKIKGRKRVFSAL